MLIENLFFLSTFGLIFFILAIIQDQKSEKVAIFSAIAGGFFILAALWGVNPESHICAVDGSGNISCELISIPGETHLAMLWWGMAAISILFMYIGLTTGDGGMGS